MAVKRPGKIAAEPRLHAREQVGHLRRIGAPGGVAQGDFGLGARGDQGGGQIKNRLGRNVPVKGAIKRRRQVEPQRHAPW